MSFRPLRRLDAGPVGQFLRFAAVGALGFVVDAGVLLALVGAGWAGPVEARGVSFACAVGATFELNRRWSFEGAAPRRYPEMLATYLGVQGLGFLCNLGVYAAGLALLPPPLGRPLPCLALASGIALAVNFTGSRLIVFSRRGAVSAGPGPRAAASPADRPRPAPPRSSTTAQAGRISLRNALILAAIPIAVVAFGWFGPLHTDAVWHDSGLVYGAKPPLLDGQPSIEPNMGVTAQALGRRAAEDVLHGRWPLWNPFQGLGAPLLGEMQSAALFPPTWLIALPQGQVLEQALLQGLAGLGCFLFFRRFGLGERAALAGALTFEVNGVFAWLRNAIFNPVALLPWLFLAVECLLWAAATDAPRRRRVALASLAAAAAALAVVAGFPEEVYLYGLMLVAWVAFRMTGLDARQNRRLLGDLALTGVLASLLSGPALVAFADYLGQADLGGHGGGGFADQWLEGAATLQYIAPYVYGRLFATSEPVLNSIVGGTGGYIGFVPVMFALGSLGFRVHRGTKVFLAAWIVLAIGVSEGVPGLHDAFMLVPLAKVAAVFRYLNASWIFAFVFLGAMFLDDVSACPPRRLGGALLAAAGLGLAVTGLALACSWSVVSDLLAGGRSEGGAVVPALAVTVALAVLAPAAALGRVPRATARRLSALMVLEAVAWFSYPYLSSPRGGRLDTDLIAFLRGHAGFGRVADTPGAGIGVNYGSYFGIALLNYDDLPVPRATADYVRRNLDPDVGATSFMPSVDAAADGRRAVPVRARLPAYARAGVAYILAKPGFDVVDPYGPDEGRGPDRPLVAGQPVEVRGTIQADMASPASTLILRLAAKGAAASGRVSATACAGGDCASGVGDVARADDGANLSIGLDHGVKIGSGEILTVRIARVDGTGDVALAAAKRAPAGDAPAVAGSTASDAGVSAPEVRFRDDLVHLAYTGRSFSAFAIDGVRPYVSAAGCALTASDRDSVDASCAGPSRLVRLELAMRGWDATVDGKPVPVGMEDGTFQVVDLPAGASHVEFRYAPRLFWPSVWAAAVALLFGAGAVLREFRPKAQVSGLRGRGWPAPRGPGRP